MRKPYVCNECHTEIWTLNGLCAEFRPVPISDLDEVFVGGQCPQCKHRHVIMPFSDDGKEASFGKRLLKQLGWCAKRIGRDTSGLSVAWNNPAGRHSTRVEEN